MASLKAIEKSRKLLIQVMGQEDFDKFIENGKIEIKHNKKGKEITYELDQDARVYNRTKNQFYCIEPICSDNLPLHDQLAIKYGYLKNNIDRVEKVANKRNLDISQHHAVQATARCVREATDRQLSPRRGRPDYTNYVDYMESLGWRRSQVVLDETTTIIATTRNLQENSTGNVLDIRCPEGQKISIMGISQIPAGSDERLAHSFRARIATNENTEIPFNTRIRMTKVKPAEDILQLSRIFYSDISMTKNSTDGQSFFKTDAEWYRFKQGIEIRGTEHFQVDVVHRDDENCPEILARNVHFALDCDLWFSS